ncbi:MAG: GTP-binding protein, partial [Pseudorhodoplanes sp.]
AHDPRIRGRTPSATLHRTERGKIARDEVLDRGAFDIDRILDIEPDFLKTDDHDHDHDHAHDHEHGHAHSHGGLRHYHDEEMQSISLNSEKPLDPEKFFPWLQNLVASDGKNILRSKGILAFKDDPDRFVFQGVHMMLCGDHLRPWKNDEQRISRAVFIGRDLPADKIREGFAACIVA